MILDGLITGYWSWCIWEWNGLFNMMFNVDDYTVWPPQSGVVLRLFMVGFHFAKSGYIHSNGNYVCSKSETWLESSGLRTTYCHQWKRSPTYFGIRLRKTRFPFVKNDLCLLPQHILAIGTTSLRSKISITMCICFNFKSPCAVLSRTSWNLLNLVKSPEFGKISLIWWILRGYSKERVDAVAHS